MDLPLAPGSPPDKRIFPDTVDSGSLRLGRRYAQKTHEDVVMAETSSYLPGRDAARLRFEFAA